MKVDLEKIKLGHSSLSDKIFAGTVIKGGVWRNKVDVTHDFVACVIAKYNGSREIVQDSDGNQYAITVEQTYKAPKKKKK